jgi:hypothetical protein
MQAELLLVPLLEGGDMPSLVLGGVAFMASGAQNGGNAAAGSA